MKNTQFQNGFWEWKNRQYRKFDTLEERKQYIKDRTLKALFDNWEKENFYYDYYLGISEPGYNDIPMIAANWNKVSRKFYSWLENYFEDEIEIDWYDEWINCSDCNKAIRQSPDSYSWQSAGLWASDCEIVCPECYESNKEDIIEYYKNNRNAAVNSDFISYLENEGFKCFEKENFCEVFETGFHPGQNDNPSKIAKFIEDNLLNYDYIFAIQSVGQFDCHWSVFIRKID